MPIIDGGSSTSGKANVDSNYNLTVNTPLVEAQAGYITIQAELDDGEVVGTRTVRQPTASIFNRLAVGIDTLQFSDYFNATAQNTAIWKSAATTFTFGFGTGGYLVFNNSSVTTTAAAQIYQTYRTFSFEGSTPLLFEFSEIRTAIPATNQQAEAGFFLANSGSAPYTPTDGVYFRFNSNGVFGVLNFNGTETVQQLLTSGQIVINDNTSYRIIINHYRIEFWGASATSDPRILLGVIPVPSANGPAFSSLNIPAALRLYHSGTAGSAVQFKVANVVVVEMDTNQSKPAAHQLNGMGLMPYQGQNGGTMGTTALYSNSLAPGAGAAMTNTTAALGTGLGGQFSTLPTLTANTDGIICSYQNPATTVTQTGRTLYITGVRIQSMVTTVLVGGPVQYFYSLAFGHTAASMATAESVIAKAPRRVSLGMETYVSAAAVGVLGSVGVFMPFSSPVVVNAGEFVAIIAKNVGTVTTTGVVTFLISFDCYYE